jgi:hypothetical protein
MTEPRDSLSVRELVVAFGGPAKLGRAVGVSTEAVCNWQAKDAVPKSRHLQVWRLAQAKGLTWRPPGMEGVTLAPAPAADPAPLATPEAA